MYKKRRFGAIFLTFGRHIFSLSSRIRVRKAVKAVFTRTQNVFHVSHHALIEPGTPVPPQPFLEAQGSFLLQGDISYDDFRRNTGATPTLLPLEYVCHGKTYHCEPIG